MNSFSSLTILGTQAWYKFPVMHSSHICNAHLSTGSRCSFRVFRSVSRCSANTQLKWCFITAHARSTEFSQLLQGGRYIGSN